MMYDDDFEYDVMFKGRGGVLFPGIAGLYGA